MLLSWWILPVVVAASILIFAAWELHNRHLTRWLVPYVRDRRRRRLPGADEEVHVLICIADHFEPKSYGADAVQARARVQRWLDEYPRQFSRFHDSAGRPPRYTFFFPIEEYEPDYLDGLADLCRAGLGEVEVHLHHD